MKRAVLLVLALGWGWLVFGLLQEGGYEHATGYGAWEEIAAWAIGAALPLLLGAFTAHSRSGFPRYLRWLCISWLVVQTAFMSLFGLVPVVGILLIVWPESKRPEPVNPPSLKVKALMRKAGIRHIKFGAILWVPDPYSERAARFRWGLFPHTVDPKDRPMYPTPDDWRREMPEIFEGTPPITNLSDLERHTAVVWLPLGSSKKPLERFSLRYGGNYQRVCAFSPSAAGREWPNPDAQRNAERRANCETRRCVFDSLNDYPPDWKRGACVFRRIDAHWFIAMCRYA